MRGLDSIPLDKDNAHGHPLHMLHGEYVPTLADHRYVSGMIAMHVMHWRAKDDERAQVMRWVEDTPDERPTRYVCQERIGVDAEVWMPTDNFAQAMMAVEYFALVLGLEFQYTSSSIAFHLIDETTHTSYTLFGMQKVRGPVRPAFELACALMAAFEFATETAVASDETETETTAEGGGLVFKTSLFSQQCPEYIGHRAPFGTLSPVLPPIPSV